MYIALLIVVGLVVGSFLTAYSYRFLRKKSISKGRSECDVCGETINWRDNIPVISYVLLGGKCRSCGKKIPATYPLTEIFTAAAVVFVGLSAKCGNYLPSPICNNPSLINIIFFLLVTGVLLAIFLIDAERKIIPDKLSFFLLAVSVLYFTLTTPSEIYTRLLSGLSASLFLLVLFLATKGKGMGLGDVKFALPAGIILGWPYAVSWIFLSFIIGAVIGVSLIFVGKAKLGKEIPFGPFLIYAMFTVLVFGDILRFGTIF